MPLRNVPYQEDDCCTLVIPIILRFYRYGSSDLVLYLVPCFFFIIFFFLLLFFLLLLVLLLSHYFFLTSYQNKVLQPK